MASLGTENAHCPGTPPRQRPQEITQAAQITGNPLSFPPWPPALDAHPEKLYSSKAQRARSSGDRVLASEAKGRTFDSCRARHFPFLVGPSCPHPPLPSVPSPPPAACSPPVPWFRPPPSYAPPLPAPCWPGCSCCWAAACWWLLAAPTDPPSGRRLSALFPCPPGALEKLVVRLAHGAIITQRERIIIDLVFPGSLSSGLRLPVVADPHRQVGPFVR